MRGRDKTAWPAEFRHAELCAWRFGGKCDCGLTNATGDGMIERQATEPEEVPMNEQKQITVKRRTDSYPGALSSQADEGYVIVDAKTGGYMAGPYVTEEFADSVRTLCDEIPNTRVERARII